MIPVLYLPNAVDFSSFGLGVLTDTISCEVTEERNGVFECLLKSAHAQGNNDKAMSQQTVDK